MLEYSIEKYDQYKCLSLKGRIDALSSTELQRELENLILSGERILFVDFAEVNYISSAGLRVFLNTQKAAQKGGGRNCPYQTCLLSFGGF